jgi:dTDP-4-dehydrorhamnose reductase
MLRLMKERESINVVNDQLGSPTYAADLAAAVMQLLDAPVAATQNPVFNYCNEGVISWYDFATAIKESSGSNCIVNPIPSAQYPTPAKRPHYSVLDTAKIKDVFHLLIPGWKESLVKCISKLNTRV